VLNLIAIAPPVQGERGKKEKKILANVDGGSSGDGAAALGGSKGGREL
jgi:hypothetical protein